MKVEVSEAEYALLSLMRAMGFGTIESLSVEKGQPKVAKVVTARIELSNPADRLKIPVTLSVVLPSPPPERSESE